MLENFDLASLEYVIGTMAYVIFSVVYFLTAPWWQTAIGRMMMLTGLATVGIGTTATLYAFLGPDYAGRDVARHIGATLYVVGAVLFLTTFLAQRTKTADEIIEAFTQKPRRTILQWLMRKPKPIELHELSHAERHSSSLEHQDPSADAPPVR